MNTSLRSIAHLMYQQLPDTTSFRTLATRHSHRPQDAPVRNLRELYRRHGATLDKAELLLAYNTYLLNDSTVLSGLASALSDLFDGQGKGKFMYRHRADEIAQELCRAYTIQPGISRKIAVAGLCEVFGITEYEAMAKILDVDGMPSQRGEGEGNIDKGSGLAMFFRHPFVKREVLVFENDGSEISDSDAWAKKGAMMIRLSLHGCEVDFYVTHLLSGGDLLFQSAQKSLQVRAAQLAELATFISNTHDPKNVAIVMGDFNLNAHNPNEYSWIEKLLPNFRDAWNVWNEPSISRATHWGGADANPSSINHDLHCSSPTYGEPEAFCAVAPAPQDTESCLDYILIEKPTAQHTSHVDLGRVLRMPFRRTPGSILAGTMLLVNAAEMRFLSDHLGLVVPMIVTPA